MLSGFQEELEEEVEPGSSENMLLYLNPLDEWCTNIEYFTYLLKLGEITPKRLSDEGQIWLHFEREILYCINNNQYFLRLEKKSHIYFYS
jgi:hypothetical protein